MPRLLTNPSLPADLRFSRLKTPIGTALLVIDEHGALRALDWSDHEDRLHRLLRLYYGAGIALKTGRVPANLRDALDGYFAGDLKQLDGIACTAAGPNFNAVSGQRCAGFRPARP